MKKTMTVAMLLTAMVGCEPCSKSTSLPQTAKPLVPAVQLLDMGAKANVPTKEILADMEIRGLRPATDSEVREWIKAGNQLPDKMIVVAELDRPETVGVLKRQMVPAFEWDEDRGKLIELSIDVPEDFSVGRRGWLTARYRFAAVTK